MLRGPKFTFPFSKRSLSYKGLYLSLKSALVANGECIRFENRLAETFLSPMLVEVVSFIFTPWIASKVGLCFTLLCWMGSDSSWVIGSEIFYTFNYLSYSGCGSLFKGLISSSWRDSLVSFMNGFKSSIWDSSITIFSIIPWILMFLYLALASNWGKFPTTESPPGM